MLFRENSEECVKYAQSSNKVLTFAPIIAPNRKRKKTLSAQPDAF